MAYSYAYELLRALLILEEYLPNIVLIGGCVPLVYSRYLFELPPAKVPVFTEDLDLLVENEVPLSGQSIVSLLQNAGYKGRTLESRHTQYFKFESNLGTGFEVEFLTPAPGTEHGDTIVIQGGLRAQVMGGLESLLLNNTAVRVKDQVDDIAIDLQVRVPTPAAFVVNKIQSYLDPIGDVDRSKDLYYIFYIVRNLPISKQTLADDMKRCAGDQAIQSLASRLEQLFRDEHSPGTQSVAAQWTGLDRPDLNTLLLVHAEISNLAELLKS